VVADTPFALVLDAGGTMLRLTPVPEPAARSFTVAGWNVPDIDATVRALAGRGVQFTRYDGMTQDEQGIWTTPGGDRVAWFTDPDGNTLSLTAFAALPELKCWAARSRWPLLGPSGRALPRSPGPPRRSPHSGVGPPRWRD
jgi:predicted enzyme related to lactoylglutathione lyase